MDSDMQCRREATKKAIDFMNSINNSPNPKAAATTAVGWFGKAIAIFSGTVAASKALKESFEDEDQNQDFDTELMMSA